MASIDEIHETLKKRNPNEPEFIQAVDELFSTIKCLIEKEPKYLEPLQRMVEPERVVMFRVPWIDDKGQTQVNRGFRVQFNSALGPYKGGLRFHPSVNLSIIKFLGFEQIFKNALTGVMLGGGKGGSDFDPRGKSDAEVMRFCQSFMSELYRHIGGHRDVPAGDIGVGGREIGYLYGQYKRITARFEGVLTGKGATWGGSKMRPEATGYGAVFFLQAFLKSIDQDIKGKRIAVSGAGNVAQFCVEKLLECGAVPVSMSDSGGCIIEEDGFTKEQLEWIMELKNSRRGRISEYAEYSSTAKYHEGERPWSLVKCDYAIPAATQNEIDVDDVKSLLDNGCSGIMEAANMPTTAEAVDLWLEKKKYFGPAKAVNAGGVAVSGLEMSQDAAFVNWTREEVLERLENIMNDIFATCNDTATRMDQPGNLLLGANVAGFIKVADAMISQGCV